MYTNSVEVPTTLKPCANILLTSHNLSPLDYLVHSEGMLLELIPGLDKSRAKRLARQLASLRALQSLDSSTGSECLKLRLKKLSKQLLEAAKLKRSVCSDASTAEDANAKEVRRPTVEVTVDIPACDVDSAKVARHHILINKVGEAKYNEILSISEEIRDIRSHSAVWTKFSQQNSSEGLKASELLPPAISNIYFRTRLVDVMRVVDAMTCMPLAKLPEPCKCIVERTNWDVLLEDSKKKLAAFRKFEMEHYKENEDLNFKCTSGMCFTDA